MPSLESATHYPGVVLFEATNLSVGRGTPVAFQLIGAPWLDAASVIDAVGMVLGASIKDTLVTPSDPSDGKYSGVRIRAIRILVTDRSVYDPTMLAVRLMSAVRSIHGDSLAIRYESLGRLSGKESMLKDIMSGVSADSISRGWDSELQSFMREREDYLLYR